MCCFKGLKEKGKELCYMITSKDTENVFDKFRDAKELMDRWLIYHNKPVDTMWLSICEELETNS